MVPITQCCLFLFWILYFGLEQMAWSQRDMLIALSQKLCLAHLLAPCGGKKRKKIWGRGLPPAVELSEITVLVDLTLHSQKNMVEMPLLLIHTPVGAHEPSLNWALCSKQWSATQTPNSWLRMLLLRIFFSLCLCDGYMHSVETTLWMLIFPRGNNMWYSTLWMRGSHRELWLPVSHAIRGEKKVTLQCTGLLS